MEMLSNNVWIDFKYRIKLINVEDMYLICFFKIYLLKLNYDWIVWYFYIFYRIKLDRNCFLIW